MTYTEIAKERDDLKTENGMLRSIMDKMLEKGKSLEEENKILKIQLEQANAGNVNCIGCKLVEINVVKEFAEKLKERLCEECSGFYIPNCFETPTDEFAYNAKEVEKIIDKLLKELEEWKTISNN